MPALENNRNSDLVYDIVDHEMSQSKLAKYVKSSCENTEKKKSIFSVFSGTIINVIVYMVAMKNEACVSCNVVCLRGIYFDPLTVMRISFFHLFLCWVHVEFTS